MKTMEKNENQKKIILDVHHGSTAELNYSWSELYALTEHWLSDLKFFQDEISFLNILIDKYLLKLIEEDNVSKISPSTMALSRLEARSSKMVQRVGKHLKHIEGLMENSFSHDSQNIKDEHLSLERDLIDFVKDFRYAKEEIFRSTEQTLRSEKAKHLLTP
jgi:hypothetical protein